MSNCARSPSTPGYSNGSQLVHVENRKYIGPSEYRIGGCHEGETMTFDRGDDVDPSGYQSVGSR